MAGALSDETEARPPVDHDPVEVPFAPLDPRVRTAWWLEAAAAAIAATALAGVAAAILDFAAPATMVLIVGLPAAICAGLLGVARLVVHTAALGTSGVLPGLDVADAERLRDHLAAAQRDTGV